MSEQQRKSPRGRWAYLDDFQRNAAGEMVYTGKHYAYSDESPLPRKKLLWRLGAAGVLSVAAGLIQGFLPAPEMRGCAYVMLPYAGALLSALSVLWATVQLSLNREPLRKYIYTPTAGALPLRAGLTMGFSAATLVGDVVYLAIHGLTQPDASLTFLGLSLLSFGGALWAWALRRRARWERVEET